MRQNIKIVLELNHSSLFLMWFIWACHRDEMECGDWLNRQVDGQYLQGMKAEDWTAKQEVMLKYH